MLRFVLVLLIMVGFITPAIAAPNICPLQNKMLVQYMAVFDGAPEEMAELKAEDSGKQSGYWELGYIYDEGRFVTIRCIYPDKTVYDIKLDKKINRCDYKIGAKKAISFSCK